MGGCLRIPPDPAFPTCPPLPSHPTHPSLFLPPTTPTLQWENQGPGGPRFLPLHKRAHKKERYQNPGNTTIIMKLTTSRQVAGRWRDQGSCARHHCRKRGRRNTTNRRCRARGRSRTRGTNDGRQRAATIPSVTALEIKAAKAPIETSLPEVVDGGGPKPPTREVPRPELPARELLAPTELPTLELLAPEPPAPPLAPPTGAGPVTPDIAVVTVGGTDTEPDEVTAINTRDPNKRRQNS